MLPLFMMERRRIAGCGREKAGIILACALCLFLLPCFAPVATVACFFTAAPAFAERPAKGEKPDRPASLPVRPSAVPRAAPASASSESAAVPHEARRGSVAAPAFAETAVPVSDASQTKDADSGILSGIADRLADVWHSPVFDLYVPLYTWHNRLMYDDSKIRKYNELPWGMGFGRSFVDEDGDWHALYAMGFRDSNDHFQPIVGYGFLKNWSIGSTGNWRAGVGYTLGITAREEYDYIPLPLPLPMAGITYKRLSLQGVYIPGRYNDGNVFFLWARWQLSE